MKTITGIKTVRFPCINPKSFAFVTFTDRFAFDYRARVQELTQKPQKPQNYTSLFQSLSIF